MRLPTLRVAHVATLAALALSACHRGAPATPAAPAPAPAAPVRTTYASGQELLTAMRERYGDKWYSTMTFTQKTSRLLADGKWNVQTWYEAMKLPGLLRIDFDPLSAGNGVLYAHDSAFTFRNGRPLPGQASINPLLLLGFDVYANPVTRTAALLRKEGFDLTHVHSDVFEGRPMIVVGARQGDVKTKQFWIDAEHLYFVRLLEPTQQDANKVQDIRFVNYERRGNAWVSPRVEIYTDGKLVFFEDYSDIRTDVALDRGLFDPAKWKTAKHWTTK